jgi:prepilin-type N-terminal cleavage/methylation domain-containing protein
MTLKINVDRGNWLGFTLVELLVVVSLIALLIALLLPALAKAREMAVRIQCASNLHEMGQALYAYAIEYHQYPPQRCANGEEMTPANTGSSYTPQENSMPGGEFNAMLNILGSKTVPQLATQPMPRCAYILTCPKFPVPPPTTNVASPVVPFSTFPTGYSVLYRDTYWANESGYYENSGGPTYKGPPQPRYYYAELGYLYLGGCYWLPGPSGGGEVTDSPMSPGNNPGWGLAADIISTWAASPTAHMENGTVTGANELFNDGHVQWIPWNNGTTERMNGGPYYQFYWRRDIDYP